MEAAMRTAFEQGPSGAWRSANIFLEDLRIYREKNLAKVGMEAIFSIWKRDTANWRARSLNRDFEARAVWRRSASPGSSFAGRDLDDLFFSDLPAHADRAGKIGSSFVDERDLHFPHGSAVRGQIG